VSILSYFQDSLRELNKYRCSAKYRLSFVYWFQLFSIRIGLMWTQPIHSGRRLRPLHILDRLPETTRPTHRWLWCGKTFDAPSTGSCFSWYKLTFSYPTLKLSPIILIYCILYASLQYKSGAALADIATDNNNIKNNNNSNNKKGHNSPERRPIRQSPRI